MPVGKGRQGLEPSWFVARAESPRQVHARCGGGLRYPVDQKQSAATGTWPRGHQEREREEEKCGEKSLSVKHGFKRGSGEWDSLSDSDRLNCHVHYVRDDIPSWELFFQDNTHSATPHTIKTQAAQMSGVVTWPI